MTTALSTPGDILRKALEKEKAARDFYADLLDHSRVGMVRELAATLKDEEDKHVRLIEKKLADLTGGRG
jgi:rubrerythrin